MLDFAKNRVLEVPLRVGLSHFRVPFDIFNSPVKNGKGTPAFLEDIYI